MLETAEARWRPGAKLALETPGLGPLASLVARYSLAAYPGYSGGPYAIDMLSRRALIWYGGITLATTAAYQLAGRLAPASAHEQTLLLGTNVWPGYEPLYLGRALGLFDPARLKLVEYPAAMSVIRAFRNGTIDAAALTLDEVLSLRQHGVPARVVLVFDFSNGADALLARPGIDSLDALRGRTIGVEQGAVGAYMLARVFERSSLSMGDVRVKMVQVDEHEQSYRSGEVDAVITFDPVRQHLSALGAKTLFDSSMIPEEIVDVLVVHESRLARDPEGVEQVIEGWFRALDHLASEPLDAATKLSGRLQLAPDQVLAVYEDIVLPSAQANRELLSGDSPRLLGAALRLAQVMAANELLEHAVELDGLIDPEPLLRYLERHPEVEGCASWCRCCSPCCSR